MNKINIGIISFRGIREPPKNFCASTFILLENWGEATGNRGDRGKTGTAGGKVENHNRGDRGETGTTEAEVENKSWITRKSAGVCLTK